MIETILTLLMGLLLMGVQVAYLVLTIILGVRNGPHLKRHWRAGLMVGLVLLVGLVPSMFFAVAYLDMGALGEGMVWVLMVGVVLGVLFQVVKVVWHALLYTVALAEWHKVGNGGPLGGRLRVPFAWRELVCPFAIGVFIAAVSVIAFTLLGIEEGDAFLALRQLFPGATEASAWVTFPTVLLLAVTLAVSEELMYRGGTMAWLMRKWRHPVARWAGVLVITLIWALAHVPNTDAPWVKITQMTIIGIVLAEVVRRGSLRDAIAVHVGLNAASVVIPQIWLLLE